METITNNEGTLKSSKLSGISEVYHRAEPRIWSLLAISKVWYHTFLVFGDHQQTPKLWHGMAPESRDKYCYAYTAYFIDM